MSAIAERLAALRRESRGDLLGGLTESQLTTLASLGRPMQSAAGEELFREGDPHDYVYLITGGRVCLEMTVPGRGRTRILTVGPGDLLAFSPLLGGRAMAASAVSTEPTELLRFDGKALRELCDRDRDFGYLLMRELSAALARRLIATRLQLLDLFRSPGSAESAGAARPPFAS